MPKKKYKYDYTAGIKSPHISKCKKCFQLIRFNIRTGKTSKCKCFKKPIVISAPAPSKCEEYPIDFTHWK